MKRLLAGWVSGPHSAQRLPTLIALLLLAAAGPWLLTHASRQARDTTRKHHLEDIEQALYAARSRHGTYPPYGEASWCGNLDGNETVRAQIETALRAQNEKYANPAKPFPTDPAPRSRPGRDSAGYFYWKRSPAVFELYTTLEAAPTGERGTAACPNANGHVYDYGLTSIWRESS